jgi:hypothetical protein
MFLQPSLRESCCWIFENLKSMITWNEYCQKVMYITLNSILKKMNKCIWQLTSWEILIYELVLKFQIEIHL